jgi:hypothetical protein
MIAILYVLRIRCSMAGISLDAGWDVEVLSMPSSIVTRVGKREAVIPGKTSASWRNLRSGQTERLEHGLGADLKEGCRTYVRDS